MAPAGSGAALIEAALAASVRSPTGALAARYRRVRHPGGEEGGGGCGARHPRLLAGQDPCADYHGRRHAERVRHRAMQPLERQTIR
jgi:hypothetical protein